MTIANHCRRVRFDSMVMKEAKERVSGISKFSGIEEAQRKFLLKFPSKYFQNKIHQSNDPYLGCFFVFIFDSHSNIRKIDFQYKQKSIYSNAHSKIMTEKK